jgi:hypothetical protein
MLTRGLPRIVALSLGWLTLSAVPTGCVYVENRAQDLRDVLGVGVGFGLGGSLRATQYVQAGASGGYLIFHSVGRDCPNPVGLVGEIGFAPFVHYRGAQRSRLTVLGKTLIQAQDPENWNLWYNPYLWSFVPDRMLFQKDYDRHFWDLGAAIYLGLGLEIDVNPNPVEWLDMILGIFCIDISGDDKPWSRARGQAALPVEEPSTEPPMEPAPAPEATDVEASSEATPAPPASS